MTITNVNVGGDQNPACKYRGTRHLRWTVLHLLVPIRCPGWRVAYTSPGQRNTAPRQFKIGPVPLYMHYETTVTLGV